jgi:tetratricopeptide (TPR) repeat protein
MNDVSARAREVFGNALEIASDAERAAYVEQIGAADAALGEEVAGLLAALGRAEGFMQQPAAPFAITTDHVALAEDVGAVIGRYTLREKLGEGGFGLVWVAEQREPVKRFVALKIVKLGMDTRLVVARFEAERQALALMDHPNIAKVLDAGATDTGRPYFVMELVRGVPITHFCDENRMAVKDRLGLFIQVCNAIQHAHQKGVIHRDIKPSNILVTLQDGVPVPRVIDFGIAKATNARLTEATLFTGHRQVVGTPAYMSPEQAEMTGIDVDTRSDVYSLGVLLYELLTGTTPFDPSELRSKAYVEIQRIIREVDPPPPSTRIRGLDTTLATTAARRRIEPHKLGPLMRGELNWIVMMALAKDRTRRYESVSELAADVERYLNDEPVLARPASAAYRLHKFVRRHRGRFAAGVVMLIALLVAMGGVGGSVGWVARDRSARHLLVEQTVVLALGEAEELQKQRKWPEALNAVRRAEAVLAGGGGSAGLQRQVRERIADATFMLKLEKARLQAGEEFQGRFDWAAADRAYAAAFREAGFDVDALTPTQAAARLRARGDVGALAAALDHWAFVREQRDSGPRGRQGSGTLTQVALEVDPEPWRRATREALLRSDAKALEALAAAEGVARQLPDTILLLAAALKRQRNQGLAIRLLRNAQRENLEDFWLNRVLAEELSAAGRNDEAVALSHLALAARPRTADAYHRLASALRGAGRWSEAIAVYEKATRAEPKHLSAHANLAWTYATCPDPALRDSRLGLEVAQRTVQLAPDSPLAWQVLGSARYRSGDWRGSIEALEKSCASQAGPEQGDPCQWLFLAMAHWQLGNKNEARRWYGQSERWLDERVAGGEEARRLQAEAAALIHVSLGGTLGPAGAAARSARAHAVRGEFRQAAAEFRKALELNPDQHRFGMECGSVLAYLEEWDAFASHCRAMVERFGNTSNYYAAEQVAKTVSSVPLERSAVDPLRLLQLADRAVNEHAPDGDRPWFPLARGMAHYRVGRFDSALVWLNQATVPCEYPEVNTLAHLYLAMAHARLGERARAVEAMARAVEQIATHPEVGVDPLGETRFQDYLFCLIARREAEALLHESGKE